MGYTLDEVILSVDRKKSKPELWVTNDEAYIKSITNEVSNITNCIVINNESSLWCADSEGMMSVYDIDDKYSIEKVYPIYNTKYTTVLSTSENTIWTNSKGSKKIHIWEGYTGKLLRTALCAQTIYELIELENDVCAVTSGGLFFWNLQLGLPSRFDNLCPPFSPKSLSTTLQKVKSQLTDSFNGISIHVKHVVSPTKCIFQYFTRKELNHWLTTRKFCSSPIGDEVNELVNQILEFEIVRPVLCNPTKNEPALDDYFVLTNKFFGDVDILSDNQCGIVLQAIVGLPDVKTSCYDKEEHNLWVGSSGGFVVLDCRTLSVIVRIKLSSPIYKIVIVNDTVWMCSDNLLLYNKYTLSQSIIDAHESNVTHITKTKDFIITAADNLSLFVWTYDGQLVRDITLKSRCLDLLYIQSKNHLLVATEKKTIDIWDVSKFESINDDTTINQDWDDKYPLSTEASNVIKKLASNEINFIVLEINIDKHTTLVIKEDNVDIVGLESKLADHKTPCYIIYRFDISEISQYIFVSYIPKEAPTQQKLCYEQNFSTIRLDIEEILDRRFDRTLSTRSLGDLTGPSSPTNRPTSIQEAVPTIIL